MQSNGTILSGRQLEVISQHHVVVGISLDGPPDINEKTRGKSDLVLGNIQKLKVPGCFGGVLCVINKHNYSHMKEILAFLENRGIYWLVANFVHTVGRGELLDPLQPNEILSAFLGIYEYTKESAGRGVLEANMASSLNRFMRPPSLQDFKDILICSYPFCGGGITTVYCDIHGILYPCGCSVNKSFSLGYINSLDEDAFFNRVTMFHTKSPKYSEKCRNCSAARICAFGCPAFDFSDPVTEASRCAATQMFYSFLLEQKTTTIGTIVQNMRSRINERRGH